MPRNSRKVQISEEEEHEINNYPLILCNYLTRKINPQKRTKSFEEIREGHRRKYQALIAKLQQSPGLEFIITIKNECDKTCCGNVGYRTAKKYHPKLFENPL